MEHRDGGIYRKKCHSSGRSVQGSKMKVTEQSPWFSGEFAARVKRLMRTCLDAFLRHSPPASHGRGRTRLGMHEVARSPPSCRGRTTMTMMEVPMHGTCHTQKILRPKRP